MRGIILLQITARRVTILNTMQPATSLYIHIPFCKSKCLFCSFVIAVGKEHRIDTYLENLAEEARHYKGAALKSVYLGGGTPSHMAEGQLETLFSMVRRNFKLEAGCEVTLEANPETVDASKAKLLHALGVNRVSLGIQSLNDKYLKFLGRNHNSRQAKIAFENLKNAFFSNISLDMMFSFPQQTQEEIDADLKEIAGLGSEHLSLYTLTIEGPSRFYQQKIKLDEGEVRARQYKSVVGFLEKAGFLQYEISNFAKPKKESRHNLAYWQSENYIGLGVGAHSHMDGRRFWNVTDLVSYAQKIKQGQLPIEGQEVLNNPQRLIEALLFGLRMNKGVDVRQLEKRFEYRLSQETEEKIQQFTKDGFFNLNDTRLAVTPQGRLVLDELCVQLI